MQCAIPPDLQDPYAITVQSSAVDERCGSIAITQPMSHTIININCVVNPDILVDVCRELRTGYRSVVAEVHSVTKKLTTVQQETQKQLFTMQQQLSLMTTLVTTLVKKVDDRKGDGQTTKEPNVCTKNRCSRIITKRFRSGKLHKQCSTCLAHTCRRT